MFNTLATFWRNPDTHRGYVCFFTFVHLIAIVGVWYGVTHATSAIIVFAVAYFFLVHLSITCGAHRMCSHESFEVAQSLQYVLVLLFSAAYQGPIIWWAGKHKHHHATEDKEGDPHSPQDGFFHSHIGWLLSKKGLEPAPARYVRHFYVRRTPDGRMRFAPAHWQMKYHHWLAVPMTFVVPTVFGFLWGDWLGGLLVGSFARLMFQYHCTWVVNSVGHKFGTHKGGLSTNVWVLAVPTVGESFHANHHESPGDFRLGRKWYEFDLGAYAIRLWALLGLASNLRMPVIKKTS